MTVRFDEDLYVSGNIQCQTLAVPAGSIVDASVAAGAGIDTMKMRHRHAVAFAPYVISNAAAHYPARSIVGATAKIVCLMAVMGVALGTGITYTVDFLKNGASILTAPAVIDDTTAAYSQVLLSLASDALVAGDFLEFVATASTPVGTFDILLQVEVDEDPI